MTIIATNRVDFGTQYTLVPGDDIRVNSGIVIVSRDGYAIHGLQTGHELTIAGSVSGAFAGIFLDDQSINPVGINRITVTEDGIIYSAGNGIASDAGPLRLTNAGHIHGADGVQLFNLFGASNFIHNSGVIEGWFIGISVSLPPGGHIEVVNDGTITGATGAAFNCFNTTSGSVTIINHGVMRGGLGLSAGQDLYDGHDGRVTGTIFAFGGDDRFLPGAGTETINGGLGSDTLDFRSDAGLRVSLDGTFAGTGRAKGDVYSFVDNILGSARGNDTLRGNDDANRLSGNGGNDRINGSDGADTLVGGAGRDRLTGGLEADHFVFAAGNGADVITDFSAAQGDKITLRAAGFGLQPGELGNGRYYATASNLAHDRDDRLIFRTTDATLWFDADGKGGKGAVLLADFTDGSRLTAADFVLIA